MYTRIFTLVFFFSAALNCLSAEGEEVLWRIGKADNDTAEFALGRDKYSEFNAAFPQGVLFIAGQSNPKTAWPYTHPAPADNWAGGSQHTFTIMFGAKKSRERGTCSLLVDLVDTHGLRPPVLEVSLNGKEKTDIKPPRGGSDDSIFGTPKAGKEHRFSVAFPVSALNQGLNKLTITSVSGSWLLYDALQFIAPASVSKAEAKGTLVHSVTVDPFLSRKGDKLYQKVFVSLTQIGKEPHKRLKTTASPVEKIITTGTARYTFLLPPVKEKKQAHVMLLQGKKIVWNWPIQRTPAHEREPVDWVDPLLGTSTSRWMLYPGPSMPFSMVKLSPDNQERCWKAGYEYGINNIAGFSHLHSWTMGALLMMPATGTLTVKPGPQHDPDAGYRSRIDHATEEASPGYYAVTLEDYDIRAELTSTTRCGFQKYTFPASSESRILFDLETPTEYGYTVLDAEIRKVSPTCIEGFSEQRSGASWNHFTVYFTAEFSKPFATFGGWTDGGAIHFNVDAIKGKGDVGAFVAYTTEAGEAVKVKTGISLVSIEQARLNLSTELGPFGWDFESLRTNARTVWNDLLSLITVEGGTDTQKTKFYTNFYRSYCARTILSDVNGKYVDMCEKVRQLEDPGDPVYGCDAFWNTFWNLNQLWTLVTPETADKWVKSLLEIHDRGGWLAKGPAGIEYSSIMVASHEIALIVSAYQKGIRNFDVQKAYKAMKEIQMNPGKPHPCGGHVGNRQLASYKELGYVPIEKGPVSNTLEYAYDDWCVAQMAEALGKNDDAAYFSKRAQFYKNVFDPSVGFTRAKHADGKWSKTFSPFSGGGFVEGNSWQYTWFVPHDVAGLIKLMGKEEFNRRLDKGLADSLPNRFNATGDRMAAYPINHGNQPNMQSAYLFNFSGKPHLTQKWARAIMEHYYGTGPYDGYPGDEDQGQMGAWYVMSAIGLFQMSGGCDVKPIYELGSPIFDKVTIRLDNRYYKGSAFVIEAKNNSKENMYIQSAELDGKALKKPWFYHEDLVDGGTLTLIMGPEPNKSWGSAPEDAPPQ